MRIIVTGNMGSGKSTVSKLLYEMLGYRYYYVSYDDLVSDAYQNEAIKGLLIHKYGTADRKTISAMIFDETDKKIAQTRKAYVTHIICQYVDEQIVHRFFNQTHVILEYPMYFEYCQHLSSSNYVVAVSANRDTQVDRAFARDPDTTLDNILNKLDSQLLPDVKVAMADFVITNNLDMANIDNQLNKLVSVIRVADLETRFFSSFHASNSDLVPIWETIKSKYTEPNRHYHNLQHLSHMFNMLDSVQHTISTDALHAITLAIWFHDIEMFAHADEARSAKTLLNRFADIPEISKHRVYGIGTLAVAASMILCTKNHSLIEPINDPILRNNAELLYATKIFLDLDMAILASTKDQFTAYDNGIRHEYDFCDDETFTNSRRAFFEKLLKKPRIYLSDQFTFLEPIARANICNALMWTYS